MRHELPTQPNLEHLKKQAKDLLDAHARGEAEAIARIREALPAFSNQTDAEVARASIALGAFIVVQGVRWTRLESIEGPDARGFHRVRTKAFPIEQQPADQAALDALFDTLRERARQVAQSLPYPERARALIDAIDSHAGLADLVVGNLRCTVQDKARYAMEGTLAKRLRIAIELCESALAQATR